MISVARAIFHLRFSHPLEVAPHAPVYFGCLCFVICVADMTTSNYNGCIPPSSARRETPSGQNSRLTSVCVLTLSIIPDGEQMQKIVC